jgi:hypothetical protein
MRHAKVRITASALAVAATAGILKAVAVIAAVQGPVSMPVVELPRVDVVAESPHKAERRLASTKNEFDPI